MNKKNLNNTVKINVCAIMLLALGLAGIPAAHANVVVWDGGPDGTGTDWNTAANWDPDNVPDASGVNPSATIALSGANVTMSASSGNIGQLIVSGNGATAPTLNITENINSTSKAFIVGSDGAGTNYGGIVNHTAGTLTLASRLQIAASAGASTSGNSGTYNFGGAQLTAPTATLNEQVHIGTRPGETGLLSMSGYGTFSSVGDMNLAGFNGTGELTVEGGNLAINIGGNFQMSGSGGGSSTLTAVIDGTGFSTINVTGRVLLDNGSGGNNTVFNLEIGDGFGASLGDTFTILDAGTPFEGHTVFGNVAHNDILSIGDYDFKALYDNTTDYTFSLEVTAIPEPSTGLLVLVFLGSLGLLHRGRRK